MGGKGVVELLGFFSAMAIAVIIISRLAAPIAKTIGFSLLGLVTVLFLARSTIVDNLPPFLNFFFAESPEAGVSQPFGTQGGTGTTPTQPGVSPTPVPTTTPTQQSPQFEGQPLQPSPPPGPRDLPNQPTASPQAPIRARW